MGSVETISYSTSTVAGEVSDITNVQKMTPVDARQPTKPFLSSVITKIAELIFCPYMLCFGRPYHKSSNFLHTCPMHNLQKAHNGSQLSLKTQNRSHKVGNLFMLLFIIEKWFITHGLCSIPAPTIILYHFLYPYPVPVGWVSRSTPFRVHHTTYHECFQKQYRRLRDHKR